MTGFRKACVLGKLNWLLLLSPLLATAGCTLSKAQPNIETSAWLFDPTDTESFSKYPYNSGYLPKVCPQTDDLNSVTEQFADDTQNNRMVSKWVNPSPGKDTAQAQYIQLCTDAFKQLVDIRWAKYADALESANQGGNAAADVVKLGLTGAATGIVGPGAQVLAGIATFVGGVQTTINQDVLYKKTVELIILQMRKDMATWGDTIQKQLNAHSYSDIYESTNDLYHYARAGSWESAITSMESDSGAQAAACIQQVKTTKKKHAKAVAADPKTTLNGANAATTPAVDEASASDDATATEPCPAAKSAEPASNTQTPKDGAAVKKNVHGK